MNEAVIEQPNSAPLALMPTTVETLIAKAIEHQTPVETMERLMVMRRELKAEAAKAAYDSALAAFQAECPVIEKTKKVFVKGALRYCYAPIESIVEQVRPLLQKHGFSYTVDAEVEDGWVTAKCESTHNAGHSKTKQFKVPVDKDAYMSAPQRFASALTFSKRYAFCNAFGILTGDQDDDNQISVPEQTAEGVNTKCATRQPAQKLTDEEKISRFLKATEGLHPELREIAYEMDWLTPGRPIGEFKPEFLPKTKTEMNDLMAALKIRREKNEQIPN